MLAKVSTTVFDKLHAQEIFFFFLNFLHPPPLRVKHMGSWRKGLSSQALKSMIYLLTLQKIFNVVLFSPYLANHLYPYLTEERQERRTPTSAYTTGTLPPKSSGGSCQDSTSLAKSNGGTREKAGTVPLFF